MSVEPASQTRPWGRLRLAARAQRYSEEILGRFIELTGNRFRVDDMVFSLDSPIIHPAQKGRMFFTKGHELDERKLLGRWLPPDLPILEFGGGLGVVACSANRLLAHPERHVVVEANPHLVPTLERNRDANHCRFQVVHQALAYGAESVNFELCWSYLGGHVNDAGANVVSVPSTTVKAVADASGFDHFSLICDIEGGEASLVEHEIDVLRDRARFILVEIHPRALGDEGAQRVAEAFLGAGFVLRGRDGWNWAFARA